MGKAGADWHKTLYQKLCVEFPETFGDDKPGSESSASKARAIRSLTNIVRPHLAHKRGSSKPLKRSNLQILPDNSLPQSEKRENSLFVSPQPTMPSSGLSTTSYTDSLSKSYQVPVHPSERLPDVIWSIMVFFLADNDRSTPVSTALASHLISPQVLEDQSAWSLTWEHNLSDISFSKWLEILNEDLRQQNYGTIDDFDIYAPSSSGQYLMQRQQRWFEVAIAFQVQLANQLTGSRSTNVYFFIQRK